MVVRSRPELSLGDQHVSALVCETRFASSRFCGFVGEPQSISVGACAMRWPVQTFAGGAPPSLGSGSPPAPHSSASQNGLGKAKGTAFCCPSHILGRSRNKKAKPVARLGLSCGAQGGTRTPTPLSATTSR